MLRFFVHIGLSPEDARDVLQETFIKIVRGAARFAPGGSARAWFWQIARNCLTDRLRQRSSSHKHEVMFDDGQWQTVEATIPSGETRSSASIEDCVSQGL